MLKIVDGGEDHALNLYAIARHWSRIDAATTVVLDVAQDLAHMIRQTWPDDDDMEQQAQEIDTFVDDVQSALCSIPEQLKTLLVT